MNYNHNDCKHVKRKINLYLKIVTINILSPGPILNSNFPVLTVVAISVFESIH